jgi:hypothetical protein
MTVIKALFKEYINYFDNMSKVITENNDNISQNKVVLNLT